MQIDLLWLRRTTGGFYFIYYKVHTTIEKSFNSRSGEWKIFNGNELGALFGWWLLRCHKKKNPNFPLDKVSMISSTVSSMILKTMAKTEGFNFVDTLTGFKWIGSSYAAILPTYFYVDSLQAIKLWSWKKRAIK